MDAQKDKWCEDKRIVGEDFAQIFESESILV
jgi:hypothetical protein